MKRRFIAVLLILACLCMFAGCGSSGNDPTAVIKSAVAQKDFYFHNVLSLGFNDTIVAGTGSAAVIKAPGITLCRDEYGALCAALSKVKQVVYEGSVSADRKQIYVTKTVVNALGGTDVYTFTDNNGSYTVTLNGKEVTAGKDQLISQFKFELLLLASAADTKLSDKSLAALGEAAKALNVKPQGNDGFTFDSKGGSTAFIAAVAGILADYSAQPGNAQIAKAKLQSVIDKLSPCELRWLGITLDDLKLLKDKIGQAGSKDAITAFLLKVCSASEVKVQGSVTKDDKSAVHVKGSLTASSQVNVLEADAAVVANDADALAHIAYKSHLAVLTVSGDLLLWPITADANVIASSITKNAAKLTVTVTPDPTITEHGILWSTDSKLADAKKAVAVKGSDGQYTVSLSGLTPNTTYYYKGYGLDKAGFTVCGPIKSFKTPADAASSSSSVSSKPSSSIPASSAHTSSTVSSITKQAVPAASNPHTGGNDATPFVVVPASAVLLSAALYFIIRRRKIHG